MVVVVVVMMLEVVVVVVVVVVIVYLTTFLVTLYTVEWRRILVRRTDLVFKLFTTDIRTSITEVVLRITILKA
jgi:hypothetical protein